MTTTITTATTALELLGTPSTIVVIIKDKAGNETLRPIYECHTWSKVSHFVEFYKANEQVSHAEIQVWHYSNHLASLFVEH